LTGAVASEIVTEARDGALSAVGNRTTSANAKGRLTASATARAGTKVGVSDPVIPCGRVIAQRIKGTLGITGLSRPRVHIDGAVWHLLKWHMSWVQNVVRQFGLYPVRAVEC